MFTSFAQLASTLEASLSLDNLQGAAAGLQEAATGIKKCAEGTNVEADKTNSKGCSKPQENSIVSGKNDETEVLLIEEISRVSELLRAKDEECSFLQAQLTGFRDDTQSRKLAFSDLQDELKATKLSQKSVTADHDDRISAARREISDLQEENSRLKTFADEKSAKLLALQSELAALPIRVVENSEDSINSDSCHENFAQSRHEDISVRRESAQNLCALNDSLVQIKKLEALIDEAKTLRRGNEDKLSASQREIGLLNEKMEIVMSGSVKQDEDRQQLVLEHSKLKEEHLRLHEEYSTLDLEHSRLRENYSKYESESSSQSLTSSSEMTIMKEKFNTLENDLHQQKAINNALKEIRDKQILIDNEKSQEISDLCTSLSELSDAVENEKNKNSAVNLEITDLKKDISDKNEKIADLQSKLNLLTEKMKDIVRKYGELKSKYSALEQTGGEKTMEIAKNLQTKVDMIYTLNYQYYFLF